MENTEMYSASKQLKTINNLRNYYVYALHLLVNSCLSNYIKVRQRCLCMQIRIVSGNYINTQVRDK